MADENRGWTKDIVGVQRPTGEGEWLSRHFDMATGDEGVDLRTITTGWLVMLKRGIIEQNAQVIMPHELHSKQNLPLRPWRIPIGEQELDRQIDFFVVMRGIEETGVSADESTRNTMPSRCWLCFDSRPPQSCPDDAQLLAERAGQHRKR